MMSTPTVHSQWEDETATQSPPTYAEAKKNPNTKPKQPS